MPDPLSCLGDKENDVEIGDIIRPAVLSIPEYVPGKPIEEVERELGIRGAIKMASNENPLGPSPEVRAAAARAAEKIALYPDANAYYLKEAIAAKHGVDRASVLVGNGLDDVLRILAQAFFAPGDEIVIPSPTFSVYASVSLLMEAKPVLVRGAAGPAHDLSAMRAAVTDRTKAVFICNPNNPTGTYAGGAELAAFVESLPKGVLLVIDEAYADFADEPDFPRALDLVKKGGRRVVMLKTFSKLHAMAGLRLGYAIADPSIISAMMRVKDPFNVNLIALEAGIAALGASDHIERSLKLVREGKKRFYDELDGLGIGYLPTQANFILINLKRDSKPLYEHLLRRGLIVRPTHSFGLPNRIRVTFGTDEQNDRFFELLREAIAAGA
jgi:histidinol-phosphate aminotransferase